MLTYVHLLAQVRGTVGGGAAAALRTLSYNPAENAVLVSSDADGGSYQLYMVPRDSRSDPSPVGADHMLSNMTC